MAKDPDIYPENAPAIVISEVWPTVGGGRYPIKRIGGEPLRVEADIFKDGHDEIQALLKWRVTGTDEWSSTPMEPGDNDRWAATFTTGEPGAYEYVIEAWPDPFRSWKKDFQKRLDARQPELHNEVAEGALLIASAAERAGAAGDLPSATELADCAETIQETPPGSITELVFSEDLQVLLDYWPDLRLATSHPALFPLTVVRGRSRFSAWYEFFPRSAEGKPAPGSTLRDCLPRLDDAAAMGFDVVYLPPVHPIGTTARKGANNSVTCQPGEPGSPWAIGSTDGGHYAVEPSLGTLADFGWFIGQAQERNLEVAMDFALNFSPDHPYVEEHPEWFHHRTDGTIKYAENPPKKYQDIYPLDFHCEDWRALWEEMRDIVAFWVDRGIRIFRVDNPHTKPVAFWDYLIRDIRTTDPDVIFLSEAFTKPKMMQALAKVGFDQSYTYFTWRTTKQELTTYLTELTQTDMGEYFCGNLWPNTPDILPFQLQNASPNAFKIRASLAATLSSSWGIYSGFEFCEGEPLGPGKEEYRDSEKYQFKERDWSAPGIREFITTLNQIRQSNPALHSYTNLRFFQSTNDQVLAYTKISPDKQSRLAIIVNLDPLRPHETTVYLPVQELGLPNNSPYFVSELVTGRKFEWRGSANYVRLDPSDCPLHILRF